MGDGARKLARDTRLRLASEHTGCVSDAERMVDAHDWFRALRESAAALDAWHRASRDALRPSGQLRAHQIERAHAGNTGSSAGFTLTYSTRNGRRSTLKRNDRF